MAAVLQQDNEPAQPVVQKDSFSIAFSIDEAIRKQILEGEALVATAEACVVDCHDMAIFAQQRLNGAIAFGRELKARRDKLIAPALVIIEEAKSQYNPGIAGAMNAEQIYRKKLADYNTAQARKLAEQKRLQEEEARRAREQAEREAAAARARAEAAAEQARKEAAAAAERERQAREAGHKRAEAAAAAERAKKEEEERQKREAGEREAERLQMEAAARAQAAQPELTKTTVGGSRETWSGALADDCKGASEEERAHDAIEKIAKAIAAGRRECIALLQLHWPTINRQASAQKKLFCVPGLKAVSKEGFVNRGKK